MSASWSMACRLSQRSRAWTRQAHAEGSWEGRPRPPLRKAPGPELRALHPARRALEGVLAHELVGEARTGTDADGAGRIDPIRKGARAQVATARAVSQVRLRAAQVAFVILRIVPEACGIGRLGEVGGTEYEAAGEEEGRSEHGGSHTERAEGRPTPSRQRRARTRRWARLVRFIRKGAEFFALSSSEDGCVWGRVGLHRGAPQNQARSPHENRLLYRRVLETELTNRSEICWTRTPSRLLTSGHARFAARGRLRDLMATPPQTLRGRQANGIVRRAGTATVQAACKRLVDQSSRCCARNAAPDGPVPAPIMDMGEQAAPKGMRSWLTWVGQGVAQPEGATPQSSYLEWRCSVIMLLPAWPERHTLDIQFEYTPNSIDLSLKSSSQRFVADLGSA